MMLEKLSDDVISSGLKNKEILTVGSQHQNVMKMTLW